jgi:protein TonB
MRDAGFYAQKSGSPTGFMMIVLLHAAVLSALILIKGPAFIRAEHPPLVVHMIEVEPEPDVIPPPDPQPLRQQQSVIDHVETVTDTSQTGPIVDTTPHPVVPPTPPQPRIELARVDLPPPVRRDAEVDPAYRGFLQPPYPPSEQRAERGGDVRVRVTIGTNGRVIAVQMLSATSDAFWRVTERQALTRWRFRPATVDGRPVESTKVMNLHFQIQDA